MQQPMFILAEGSERTRGQAAQDSNIRAGKAVANAVRTTLGPRGMDKMLVDSSGEVVITNDGATILNEMDIEHPAAQMIVEVSQTQEDEVGDGTTTAAVLTGELLAQAEDLLEADLHPTVIVEGYHEAASLAQEAIDAQVLDIDLEDDILEQVAESSMTGKGTGDVTADVLAKQVVKAVRQVADGGRIDRDGSSVPSRTVDRDDIHIHTQTGASSSATELVEGVVIDKEPVSENMPRKVEDATAVVLDMKLDVRKAEADTEYNITNVDQLNAAIEAEDTELRGYAKTLADAGVDVVFCTKSIDDRVAGYLADAGILAFKSVKKSDARALARATGAKRLGSLSDLDESDFGRVDSVSVKKFSDDELTFIEGGEAAKAVTLFLRGGTEHVVDELERAMNDAVDVVIAALDNGGVVPGAGATEIAIADHIRSESAGIEGRKQLAVTAFADAVDSLPRTLAENTGMDSIDALVDLRAAHERDGRAGIISTGRSGEIGDPVEAGILDPAAVKREAIESATEAATMIVRIDDVIAAE
ncbi:thermosome subunit alpha [Haloprofundus salinisoli]|uniref:thermosome subunit alpha n=1 Tax=Haloprofundus salinisoli TaxID=2876193 RepID=UPI001CC9A6A0|nr:thermosome subunit alpha [Haloprofundus salinisoli]